VNTKLAIKSEPQYLNDIYMRIKEIINPYRKLNEKLIATPAGGNMSVI